MTGIEKGSPVAIVTGAGSGVGEATATALLARGWNVVLVGRRPEALAKVAGGSSNSLIVSVDLGATGAAREVVEATLERFARIDALINNAGAATVVSIAESTPEVFAAMHAVNVLAPAALMHHAWAALVATQGVIVNVSSMASIDPFDGFFAYGSSKAALNALTVSAAKEGAAVGVRAFTVSPGVIDTPMHARMVGPTPMPEDAKLSASAVADVIVRCVDGRFDGHEGDVLAVVPTAAKERLRAWVRANPSGRVIEVD